VVGRSRLMAAALAVSAGVGGVVAAGSAARGQAGDFAVGSALNEYPTPAGPGLARLTVSAHSGPAGENPRGHVHGVGTTGVPMGEFDVYGRVTCVRVDGNRAAIKYRFDKAAGSAAPFKGGGVEIFVEDNGPPRGNQPVDANAADPPQPAGVFDSGAATCDDPNLASYDTVKSGNYTVRDRTLKGGGPKKKK
jgi:hypothetical protein